MFTLNVGTFILLTPYLCRFGCAHLMATNLCAWLNILAKESLIEIQHAKHVGPHCTGSNNHGHKRASGLTPCEEDVKILGKGLKDIAIFLYPLAIEFTLIGAILFYKMYRNIGHM